MLIEQDEKEKKYLVARWPESQLFMEDYQGGIHLVNDESGIRKYGFAAYLVEESIYKKVVKEFEKDVVSLPNKDRLDLICS
ncbi:MAG: hypothetical protein AAFZ15_23185 [Bacteroidota bacterium]